MKKKILIVFTGAMNPGGIERSLLGLLDSIDYDRFDADLFLYGHHGDLFKYINPKVNLLPEIKELAYLRESFFTKIWHGAFYSAFCRIVEAVIAKFTHVEHDQIWAHIMRLFAPKLKTQYDIALGFFRPFDFITEKVNAKIKIGWIHTDYSYNKAKTDFKFLFNDYSRVDYIAAVSDDCAKTFCEVLPELKSKVIVIENILPSELIKQQALEAIPEKILFSSSCMNLLSVGRFSRQKNFDNVPQICRLLLQAGINAKWYIIGFGDNETLIRRKIEEENMSEHVIILGKKSNPYPYITACDIYVQPSRYEGKSVAVREAQILGKPVVITNYATAKSQLENGVDGIIVPMDNEGCAEGIAKFIRNKNLRQNLIDNMRCKDYANVKEFTKICKIMQRVN